jgi:hypothetical protein
VGVGVGVGVGLCLGGCFRPGAEELVRALAGLTTNRIDASDSADAKCSRPRAPSTAANVESMTNPGSKDPLHGITLERIVTELVARHGWEGLAARIDVRCFKLDPSIKSSLTFLRRTPWARKKVEALYLEDKR